MNGIMTYMTIMTMVYEQCVCFTAWPPIEWQKYPKRFKFDEIISFVNIDDFNVFIYGNC